jgi:hypothetical protein
MWIDPDVKHVGISRLRDFTATRLRDMGDEVIVFQDGEEPLAVMFSYERYQGILLEFRAFEGITTQIAKEPSK